MFYDFWPFFKKFQEHRFFYTNWWMLQVFRVSENSGFFITAFFAKILALKGENHLFLHFFFCNEQFFVMKTWQDIKKKLRHHFWDIRTFSNTPVLFNNFICEKICVPWIPWKKTIENYETYNKQLWTNIMKLIFI